MRTWVDQRMASGSPPVTLDRPDGSGDDDLLRATVSARSPAAEDQLADLMMDMHLLGLQPSVVPEPDRDGLQTQT